MLKRVLVTGGSKGIGKAISAKLAINDWEVLLCGRNIEDLNLAKGNLHNSEAHKSFGCDLKQKEEVMQLTQKVEPIDGLVFNAGVLSTKPLKYLDYEEILDTFKINVFSSMQLVNDLLKHKKLKKGASIVFISSMATSKAIKGNAVYTASKAALNGFVKVSALELAKKGIRVNTVKPGFIQTNLTSGLSTDDSKMKEHLLKYPLGRFGEVEDVANAVNFLLSNDSEWITGAEINVDGGYGLT